MSYFEPIFTTKLGSSMMEGFSANCWYETIFSLKYSEKEKTKRREIPKSLQNILELSCVTCQHTCGDPLVVGEPPTKGDGDRWEVRHGVTVAVHTAVPSRADGLRGLTGAVGPRVRDAPQSWTAFTVGGGGNACERHDDKAKTKQLCTTDIIIYY